MARRRVATHMLLALSGLASLLACATPIRLSAGRSLFFQVSGGETVGRIYLLGSVHVGSRPLELDARIRDAFERSEEIVLEVDPAQMDPSAMLELVQLRGTLPPPQSIADVVSPPTWELLQRYGRERHLDLGYLQSLRPWAIMMMVTAGEFERMGLATRHGVEAFFARLAGDRKPVRGLETSLEQVKALSELPPALEERLLADSLRGALEPGAMAAATGALLDAWERGDEDGLHAAVFGAGALDPSLGEFFEAMYFARNETMADRLHEFLLDGVTRFCVIGAAHLVGPRGVVALLRERGFSVQRPPLDAVPQQASTRPAAPMPPPAHMVKMPGAASRLEGPT